MARSHHRRSSVACVVSVSGGLRRGLDFQIWCGATRQMAPQEERSMASPPGRDDDAGEVEEPHYGEEGAQQDAVGRRGQEFLEQAGGLITFAGVEGHGEGRVVHGKSQKRDALGGPDELAGLDVGADAQIVEDGHGGAHVVQEGVVFAGGVYEAKVAHEVDDAEIWTSGAEARRTPLTERSFSPGDGPRPNGRNK